MRYLIHIPGPDHQSAGVRALHVLKEELQLRGHEAAMLYETRFDRANDFVVYPEVTVGNPLRAERQAMWFLNRPRDPSVPDIRFAWNALVSPDPILAVNVIEEALWRPLRASGQTVGVWVGKGRLNPAVVPEGAVVITRDSHPTREGLAEFVQTLDHLISFDPFSSMNLEALCCGVPVRLYEDEQWSRADVELIGWTPFGVAFEDEEMLEARKEVGLAYSYYFDGVVPTFSEQVDRFIDLTQHQ